MRNISTVQLPIPLISINFSLINASSEILNSSTNFLFTKKKLAILFIYKIFCLDKPHFFKSFFLIFLIVLGVIFFFKGK